MSPADFTHFDEQGKAVMVDVGGKEVTQRTAVAEGTVHMSADAFEAVKTGGIKKGDVLAVARLAGIMGAKKTADLIPLCHPLGLDAVSLELSCDDATNAVHIVATCAITARTGVEMEALTAVSVAALTVYDMCKSMDKAMRIGNIRLLEKTGGRSGTYRAGPL